MRHHRLPALTAVTLFVLDQMLKAYFGTAARIPIVEPYFYLSNFRNVEPTTYPPIVHALGMAICLVLILYLTRRWRSRAFTWGFWLLAAGNTGNLVNAWWPGYWVDYIEFPAVVAFNLVDVMIFGGYALVGVGVVGAAIQMRRPRYPENQSTSCPKNACKQTSKQ
ncbi:MAG: signal peptidase II [Candidatus Desulforudaceae bacterium]